VIGGAGDLVRSLTPTQLARRRADEIKGRFRSGEYGGLIEPAGLLAEIRRQGGTGILTHFQSGHPGGSRSGSETGDSSLMPPIEHAVRRFEQDDFTTLDPRRLDEAIRQMWKEVPVHKKIAHGLTPLAAVFAAFGAVLMVPLDFGANLVLAASIPELLAAAGLSTLAAMWAGNQGAREVGQQAARQQLADFHSVLCDELGIARPDPPMSVEVGGSKVTLPTSRIPKSETAGPSISVYRVRDEFVSELKKLLPRNSEVTK